MTQVERDVLKSLQAQLLKSSQSGFKGPAQFEEWANWAREMRDTIKASNAVFEALLKQPVEDEQPSEKNENVLENCR